MRDAATASALSGVARPVESNCTKEPGDTRHKLSDVVTALEVKEDPLVNMSSNSANQHGAAGCC